MKYDIVYVVSPADLVREVNERCRRGWIPHGSVAVVVKGEHVMYLQPMIQHEPPVALLPMF